MIHEPPHDRRTGLWATRLPGFTTKAVAIRWIRDQLSLADQERLPHGDRTPLGEYLDYWAGWMPEHVTRFLNAVEARPWWRT